METFKKLNFNLEATIKVACEPLNPSELPKLLEGLRKVSKSYPLATTRAEESGEHIIVGTGELYLDQIIHDLRKLYAEIEIKVSEPFVSICETVLESSSFKCFGETPNKKNKLFMIAEPLDKGLAEVLSSRQLYQPEQQSVLADVLVQDFNWDELSANSVWAFGPSSSHSNMLLDYTLSSEVDRDRLSQVKNSVV